MKELYTLVTPAAIAPVSLEEGLSDLRIDNSDEDDLIEAYIRAATEFCSEVVGRKLINEVWKYSIRFVGDGKIELPFQPVSELIEVQYFDNDNASQTIPLNNFYVYNYDTVSTIEPVLDYTWPLSYNRRDAINITFKTGYGDNPESVPETIRRAIRLMVVHMYEIRSPIMVGPNVIEVPMSVQALLSIERRGWMA